MSSPVVRVSNRQFRRALLSLNGLSRPLPDDPLPWPTAKAGPEWAREMVGRLGFVQVDAVSAVERAHHHILFSRNHRYTRDDLRHLVEADRTLFENWTHDAAILPSDRFPYWRHYFERVKRFEPHPGYRRYFSPVTPRDMDQVLRRIRKEGALKPRDFASRKVAFDDPVFPGVSVAKLTLELLWRTGKVAVTRRDGQAKVYDLSQRVIPDEHLSYRVSKRDHIDEMCRAALVRLGAATANQIVHFFDAVSREEVQGWLRRNSRELVEIRVDHADGSQSGPVHALASQIDALREAPAARRGLRLINPFDPLIHDRQRTERVFGFDYRIEIWVPPKKRKYGYYVLPILEGERFTGRLDAKADSAQDCLRVLGLWWEPGIRATATRMDQLEKQLEHLARCTDTHRVVFAKGYAKT